MKKMRSFLKPFVTYMNEIGEKGFKCTIQGVEKVFKLNGLCCCVDSVARAPMQGITQFNGFFGCSWCLHCAVWCKKGNGGSMKYILLDEAKK